MIKTKKLYYEDNYLSSCVATIIDIDTEKGIVLDQTVAYPEGGGQVSDIGVITIGKHRIPFFDCQKGIGKALYLDDFPVIKVDTRIYHKIADNDYSLFKVGDTVTIYIDIQYRIKATLYHSATHIALMALTQDIPNVLSRIKGCKINTENSRVDFLCSEKLTNEEIERVNNVANVMIQETNSIKVFPHTESNEAWYWKCKDMVMPCGGTHVENTSVLGSIKVKRKGIGKGVERINITLDNPHIDQLISLYH